MTMRGEHLNLITDPPASQWDESIEQRMQHSLAHLLDQPVVLEALVYGHLALGLAFFLNDLFDVFLVFGGGLLLCLRLLGLGRFSRLPRLLICDTLLGLLSRRLLGC